MALTITATASSASANSYVTEAEFKTWTDARLNVTSYQNATPDQRQRALLMAFDRLQREPWLGERSSSTQAAAWPRTGAIKPDGVGVGGADGFLGAGALVSSRGGYGIYAGGAFDVFSSTEIPQAIKDAQCALALAYLDGFDEFADRITSVSQDGLTIRKDITRPIWGLPGEVARLIAPLRRGGSVMRA